MHRPEVTVAASIFDWCIDPFRCHLQQRLNPKKVEGAVRPVAQFLQGVEKSGVLSLSAITPQIICEEFERATDKHTYTHAMRHFLKYAAEKLLIPFDYSYFVPSVRRHHAAPSVYTKEQVEQVLMNVDRGTASGKRTYAALILCARLGLRISDVCNLEFSHVRKASKTIELIQVKTKIPLKLPLLPDVEEALDDYITNARPKSDNPKIFLRVYAPFEKMQPTTINYEMRILLERAGIDTTNKRRGPHSLRASLASALLHEGNSYPVVQKALGHHQPNATKYYTKMDILQLRDCALEVPGPSGKFAEYLANGRY